jgi:D-galactarolactone cycloisomerase
MASITRRSFAAALAGCPWLASLKAAERAAKPVRIRDVDIFTIEIPTPAEEVRAGKMARYSVVRIDTDAGVRGYSFGGASQNMLAPLFRPMLAGRNLFAVDRILKEGARGLSPGPVGGPLTTNNMAAVNFGAVEHAIWDAIGKIAGLPVYRMLGGSTTSIKAYVTCVWRGKTDQSDIPYKAQAEHALKLKNAGFKGMKIRAWRPNPLDDADACGEIRAAVGDGFAIMFDRTADWAGWVWDYETAVKVCRAMEKHNAYWMEEPFLRTDLLSHRRLAREVDILITGANGCVGLDDAREALVNEAFDILQPDAVTGGGILTNVKIAHMADAFHVPVTLHGAMGLRLDGSLQISAAIGAPWQELVMVTPPLLPQEIWSPALKVIKRDTLYKFVDGEIQVPDSPGLGLDISEDALMEYRVPQKT